MRLEMVPSAPPMRVNRQVAGANFVNVHRVDVAAPAKVAYGAVLEFPAELRRAQRSPWLALPLLAAALLRRDLGRPQDVDLRVADFTPGEELVLGGRHRYAEFAANLFIEPRGPARSRVYCVSRARFKRTPMGRLYLAGVQVFHDAYVEWALQRIKQRAESLN